MVDEIVKKNKTPIMNINFKSLRVLNSSTILLFIADEIEKITKTPILKYHVESTCMKFGVTF